MGRAGGVRHDCRAGRAVALGRCAPTLPAAARTAQGARRYWTLVLVPRPGTGTETSPRRASAEVLDAPFTQVRRESPRKLAGRPRRDGGASPGVGAHVCHPCGGRQLQRPVVTWGPLFPENFLSVSCEVIPDGTLSTRSFLTLPPLLMVRCVAGWVAGRCFGWVPRGRASWRPAGPRPRGRGTIRRCRRRTVLPRRRACSATRRPGSRSATTASTWSSWTGRSRRWPRTSS